MERVLVTISFNVFMLLFGQDADTFTSTMVLNVDQLQKQLDKDEFQEDGSMAAFWVVNNQFQKFIGSQFTLDYDSQMTDKYFVEYTGIEVKHFRDTLLQHMGNVKKSVAERTRHQRQYDRWVNRRQMQTQESKIDMGKAVDADLVVTKSSCSPNKTFVVYEKTSPRSDLRWKPMGRIFKSVGLRWIPKGKLFDSCTSKVDSDPPHGSNVDIPNIHECKQTLDVSACTSINVQKEQSLDLSAELESLFGHLFDEYFNGVNQVVSKSSADTAADASDKCQQQPDSTSSTSTLATTVTADGNFDL
ncbi:hypothetical protein Tco_0912688 [Tanacetum coccineum]